MASFDYCKKCNFPRYIEGYNGLQDYIDNGWVQFKSVTQRIGFTGITDEWTTIEWLCPECATAETDRQALMEIGSVGQVQKRGRYGSVVNRRTEGS